MKVIHPAVQSCDLISDNISLVTQMVKNLPSGQETWVWSLGSKDSLEKEMTIHSSILVWRFLWTNKPDRLQATRSHRVGHDWAANTYGPAIQSCDLISAGSWWWTGRPGVLRFMGSQRVGHDWVTELNWTEMSLASPESLPLINIRKHQFLFTI